MPSVMSLSLHCSYSMHAFFGAECALELCQESAQLCFVSGAEAASGAEDTPFEKSSVVCCPSATSASQRSMPGKCSRMAHKSRHGLALLPHVFYRFATHLKVRYGWRVRPCFLFSRATGKVSMSLQLPPKVPGHSKYEASGSDQALKLITLASLLEEA